MFAAVSMEGFSAQRPGAGKSSFRYSVPLANAAVGWPCALYTVMQDSGLHSSLAWLMVALAAPVSGADAGAGDGRPRARMHLACAVIF